MKNLLIIIFIVALSGIIIWFFKKPNNNIANGENHIDKIILPQNLMTEQECLDQGGEIFNTLGKNKYDGELIGMIKGLRCPCACLIKDNQIPKKPIKKDIKIN